MPFNFRITFVTLAISDIPFVGFSVAGCVSREAFCPTIEWFEMARQFFMWNVSRIFSNAHFFSLTFIAISKVSEAKSNADITAAAAATLVYCESCVKWNQSQQLNFKAPTPISISISMRCHEEKLRESKHFEENHVCGNVKMLTDSRTVSKRQPHFVSICLRWYEVKWSEVKKYSEPKLEVGINVMSERARWNGGNWSIPMRKKTRYNNSNNNKRRRK